MIGYAFWAIQKAGPLVAPLDEKTTLHRPQMSKGVKKR
jgi:hypothetical protein